MVSLEKVHGYFKMESKDFSLIRHYLGKTRNQLSIVLCISPKSIQSFEQGWRKIPTGVERQLLLLLSLKRIRHERGKPCWEIRNCPAEWRENCVAWEFKAGYLCWFINGTFCQGRVQENWSKKMMLCRQCDVFRSMLPTIYE